MPRFDRTGPKGQGSKTGRGMGKCNPQDKTEIEEIDQERTQKPVMGNERHKRFEGMNSQGEISGKRLRIGERNRSGRGRR